MKNQKPLLLTIFCLLLASPLLILYLLSTKNLVLNSLEAKPVQSSVYENITTAWEEFDELEKQLMKLGENWQAKSIPSLVSCGPKSKNAQIWTNYWGRTTASAEQSTSETIGFLEEHGYKLSGEVAKWEPGVNGVYSYMFTMRAKHGARFEIEITNKGNFFVVGLSSCINNAKGIEWRADPSAPLP